MKQVALLDGGSGQSVHYGSNGTDQGSNGDRGKYSILLDVDNVQILLYKNNHF